jgi:hypothetical protein
MIPRVPCSAIHPIPTFAQSRGKGFMVMPGMKTRKVKPSLRRTWMLHLLLALCFAFPSSAAAGGNQGILEVRIKDHREAIGDFATLSLKLDELLISPKPGLMFWRSGWKPLAVSPQSIDLTKYVAKDSARVFRGRVNVGSFDAIHLKLKEVSGILNKKGRDHIEIKNLVGPIKLPFEIRAQSETLIILDLVVLDMSDHPSQGYELGIKGYELHVNGKLTDKVPPE